MHLITRHDVPWGLEELAALARWPARPPGLDEVDGFEAELAAAIGAEHAVLMPSGSAALCWILAALAPRGGEVVVPAYGHPGLLEVVAQAGCEPCLARVDPLTRLLDPDGLASVITPRTRAVVAAHLYGRPCDVAALREAAPGVPVVGDGAHGLGAGLAGGRVGGIEEACAFSFRSGKPIVCGWGGAVTTSDPALAQRIRARLAGAAAMPAPRIAAYFLPVLADLLALRRPVFAAAVLPVFRTLDRLAPGLLEGFWTGRIGPPLAVDLRPRAFPPILARLARLQLHGLDARSAQQVANSRALFALYPKPRRFEYPPDRRDGATHLCLAVACADAYCEARALRSLGVDTRVDYMEDLDRDKRRGPVRVLHLPNHFRLGPADMEAVAAALGRVDRDSG